MEEEELPHPPDDYMPHGFLYFVWRGPLADKKYRVDLLSLDQQFKVQGTLAGRAAHREEESKKKKAKRDYELGVGGAGGPGGRGLSLTNQRDMALVAQQEARLSNQTYDSEIVKLKMVLDAKKGQADTYMDMAKLYRDLGDIDKAKAEAEAAKEVLGETKEIEKELYALKNSRAAKSSEVDRYLKAAAGTSSKKQPAQAASSSNDADPSDSDGDLFGVEGDDSD